MRTLTALTGCAVAVCLFVNSGYAGPVVNVGNHNLLPNTPNQTVNIFVSGGDEVQGLTMRVQVADGGTDPRVGGTIDGPSITNVDLLTNTIFSGNNTGQSNVLGWDQIWVNSTTTLDGTVRAEGVLARVTLDTSGFFEGMFALSLKETRDGATDFAGTEIAIQDGTISIIPEPHTIATGLVGLGALIHKARRRRGRQPDQDKTFH